MNGIVISGYASLDHVIVLDGDVRPGRTTTILSRPEAAWPRLGGGPAYVAQAIGKAYSGDVRPLSWIGEDASADVYLSQLFDNGISCDGMAKVKGARTPIAVLAYDPNGDCACLYDPGLPPSIGFTEEQQSLMRQAEWICITIGPKLATDQLLDLIAPEQKLAWIVKNDPRAITPEQTAALAARADLMFCNGKERDFLERARTSGAARRAGQTIVETQGRRGALFLQDGTSTLVAADPIDVTDPTGAGDTFAGGVIAAIMNGQTDPEEIGRAGNAAARALLLTRKSEENESR